MAAVLDLVKTALAIQDLKNTLDTLPFAVVAEVMGIEVPGLSLEKVDDLKNMAYGAVAALQEPPRVLAALGQKIGDTVEEEGIAYSISYVAADVAIQILLSKGLGEVKNVSKADDLVDVARTVDTLDDTVKIADELTDAAIVVYQVGDIANAAMAVNVMDEAKVAVKAVDKFEKVAESGTSVEKVWNYSKQFDGELVNFNSGYEIKNVVSEDLYLVQFHSNAKVGSGRSLKYWTTFEEANGISTIDDYMNKMALLSNWGSRDNVSIAKIPAGTKIKYAIGTAKEQVGAIESRAGGGLQILFEQFNDGWILDTKPLP